MFVNVLQNVGMSLAVLPITTPKLKTQKNAFCTQNWEISHMIPSSEPISGEIKHATGM